MVKFSVKLSTNGKGYWSNVKKKVTCEFIQLSYVNDERDFGELRVYFDTKTWDIEQDSLIYTDSQFLSELRDALNYAGMAGADVDYSEQGMQGNNYVSLDVGKKFIDSWLDIVTI